MSITVSELRISSVLVWYLSTGESKRYSRKGPILGWLDTKEYAEMRKHKRVWQPHDDTNPEESFWCQHRMESGLALLRPVFLYLVVVRSVVDT